MWIGPLALFARTSAPPVVRPEGVVAALTFDPDYTATLDFTAPYTVTLTLTDGPTATLTFEE